MEQTNFSKIDLSSLVKELESQKLRKRDLIVPSTALSMQDGRFALLDKQIQKGLSDILSNAGICSSTEEKKEIFELTESCHSQVSDKLGIPGRY